jgi:TPR repeat protein
MNSNLIPHTIDNVIPHESDFDPGSDYDLEHMIEALVQGRGDWVYKITLPLAEAGLADAQVMMGVLRQLGISVPQDAAQSIEWYRKAAAQDHPIAWKNLGTVYLIGLPDGKPDKIEALHCFSKARALEMEAMAKQLLKQQTRQ